MNSKIKTAVNIIVGLLSLLLMIKMQNLNYFQKSNSVDIKGVIDEVCTPAEELYKVNEKINPILNSLKENKFFRIFKVNLESECPFWQAEGK